MAEDIKNTAENNMAEDVVAYQLEEQIGFILRRASQRHLAIFSQYMPESLTPTQFAMIARLYKLGQCSQNELGRQVAVDVVTTKGVVTRLKEGGYIAIEPDPHDKRRLTLSLTDSGKRMTEDAILGAKRVTAETLKPLNEEEALQLKALLARLT